MVCIENDGPGIPEEYHRRIFEKFETVDIRRGEKYSTGLGLAFSKMAIEAMGGEIWVESEKKTLNQFEPGKFSIEDSLSHLDSFPRFQNRSKRLIMPLNTLSLHFQGQQKSMMTKQAM